MKDVKIIEDANKLLNKTVKIDIESALIQEPMSMYDIEEWEGVLERMNLPYVLAEVTVKNTNKSIKNKWETGYMLFLTKEDLSSFFSRGETVMEEVKEDLEFDTYTVRL